MSAPAKRPVHGVRDRAGTRAHDGSVVCLLDVNVIIALLDPLHPFHPRAHEWLAGNVNAWASCAMTQNGFVRIVSHPRYANAMASPAQAVILLQELCAQPAHQFWLDDVSLLDAQAVDASRLLSSGQTTDTYLLALAVKHGGKLATFDKRVVSAAVLGGCEALAVID